MNLKSKFLIHVLSTNLNVCCALIVFAIKNEQATRLKIDFKVLELESGDSTIHKFKMKTLIQS